MSHRAPPFRRPFSDLERKCIAALAQCSFQPGTNAKRFVHDMAAIMEHRPDLGITIHQAHLLMCYVWRFRRQVPAALVPKSDPWRIAPDFGPAQITDNQALALQALVELHQADVVDWRVAARRKGGKGFSFQLDKLAARELIEPVKGEAGAMLWRVNDDGVRALDAYRAAVAALR